MLNEAQARLLALAAKSSRAVATEAPVTPSILVLAAASYGARPVGDTTIPTGFDPVAVTLFESIIEAAYLVATADGTFDDDERRVFEGILSEACGAAVPPQQITALIADLHNQLRQEGIERRIANLAVGQSKTEHAHEVLRVAALVGQASHGVSAVEKGVLERIASSFGLSSTDVDAAVARARSALSPSDDRAAGAVPDSRR